MSISLCDLIQSQLNVYYNFKSFLRSNPELKGDDDSEVLFQESYDSFNNVMRDTCMYLIGTVGAFEYQRAIKKHVTFSKLPISAKEFRLSVLELGRYTLNLKLYMINLIKTQNTPKGYSSYKEFRRKTCLASGVLLSDGGKCYRVLKPYVWKLRRHAKIKAIPKVIVNPYQKSHWHLKFNSVVYKPVMKTIKQITYTKLRFISSSTNSELSDLHSELAIKALQTYYRLVPTVEDDAYIINYIRRAVSNHAKNIIKMHTSQKRGRMVKSNADGFGGHHFDLIIVSENQIKPLNGVNDIQYDQLGDSLNSFDSMRSIESKLSIKALKRKYRAHPIKYKVLKLVLSEDEGFTKFLRSKGLIRIGTNEDFQKKCGSDKYLELIAEYVRVKGGIKSIRRFLKSAGNYYANLEENVRHVSNR